MPRIYVQDVSLRRRRMKYGLAAALRAAPTDAEHKLWFHLRSKRMNGVRFRRQQPIGPYVADFFCPVAKLIVELDGDQHGESAHRRYDESRTRWLSERGYAVMRFGNWEVLRQPAAVLDGIEAMVRERIAMLRNASLKPSP
jgi:very-short-patch-repair endonuclease